MKERSQLIQKQKQLKSDLEKKVKKLKGAMKTAAQTELEELEAKQEAELKAFESGGAKKAEPGAAKAEAKAEPQAAKEEAEGDPSELKAKLKELKDNLKKQGFSSKQIKDNDDVKALDAKLKKHDGGEDDDASQVFPDRQWNGLSKKELEEACKERGVGKGGNKEELVVKLINFHSEQKLRAKEATEKAAADRPAPAKKAPAADSDEEDSEEEEDSSSSEEEEDDDDEEGDDDEESDVEEVSNEEVEKQHLRTKAIQKGIKYLLEKKCPDGFKVSELAEKLASINVKGFAPEKCGYKTVEKFVKGQPAALLHYSKTKEMIKPPKGK